MRILIIEDEIKIASALKRGLQIESYAVDICTNGKEGLSFALSEEYDVILLDRMLPGGMDGVEICQKIREKNFKVPILMLTARDGIEDRVEGLNAGADDYLVKPFAFSELLARIRALLRRPKDILQNELLIRDLKMNLVSKEVSRAGSQIDLSVKEFALLEYLLVNKGRVLTKDSIISHVWDYDADILPNTVEVYIGYLRNKIEKPFKGPKIIQTVRGFGYKIEDK